MRSQRYKCPAKAFRAACDSGKLPVAIPTPDGVRVAMVNVNTAQGTFLARSSSDRARALAAVMAASDLYEM